MILSLESQSERTC